MPAPGDALTDEDRRRRRAVVAERIRAYAGLDPPGWLLEARLDERAKELGLDEAAYLSRAAGDDAAAGRELEALSELLRVGETRFFRHRAHVAALEGRVLPERARAAQLAVRASTIDPMNAAIIRFGRTDISGTPAMTVAP